jgi:hypothetical protein
MSVRRRWPQGFRWWLFCQFPHEDTAADYERRYDCPESPKLHLLHCGVLRCSTPLAAAIITRGDYQVLRSNSGSFAKLTAVLRATAHDRNGRGRRAPSGDANGEVTAD